MKGLQKRNPHLPDTAKQGKRSELGKHNADRKLTSQRKRNVDEILSDMGNSPIINDSVEWVKKFFLEYYQWLCWVSTKVLFKT